MKTILYSNGLKALGEELKHMIHVQVTGGQIETDNLIEHISQILQRPLNNVSAVILLQCLQGR